MSQSATRHFVPSPGTRQSSFTKAPSKCRKTCPGCSSWRWVYQWSPSCVSGWSLILAARYKVVREWLGCRVRCRLQAMNTGLHGRVQRQAATLPALRWRGELRPADRTAADLSPTTASQQAGGNEDCTNADDGNGDDHWRWQAAHHLPDCRINETMNQGRDDDV